jgi:prevent-host-death family protein
MAKRLSSRDARARFAALLDRVYATQEPVIVEKKGQPRAVVISPQQYDQLRQAQIEHGWAVMDAIHDRNGDADPEEVYRDVSAVVEVVRQERYDEQRRSSGSG